jgi:hypothetical protein
VVVTKKVKWQQFKTSDSLGHGQLFMIKLVYDQSEFIKFIDFIIKKYIVIIELLKYFITNVLKQWKRKLLVCQD